MLYKATAGSACGQCKDNKFCALKDIPETKVYQNIVNKKLYAEIADAYECTVMCEVEPETKADTEQLKKAVAFALAEYELIGSGGFHIHNFIHAMDNLKAKSK